MGTSLFRAKAIDHQRPQWLGDLVLVQQVSVSTLTVIATVFALLIACLFAFGGYTKKAQVSGELVPNRGVLKVSSPQYGVITEKKVLDGQVVKKGEVLFVLSSERRNRTNDAVQASISQQLALRRRSIEEEINQTVLLQVDELSTQKEKIKRLKSEQSNLTRQIDGQKVRIELAEANFKRAGTLVLQGYVSKEMLQQKHVDVLEQENRLSVLERDQINIRQELQIGDHELATLPYRQRNEIAKLERLLASTTQEWAESEGKRQIQIVAECDGIATAVIATPGQSVNPNQSLASIIPSGAKLEAHLYAPSRVIGFIRPGHHVVLRYQAYPYQKFGHAIGTVVTVSHVTLSENELALPTTSKERLYLITVDLASQFVTAYGKREPLQAGMTVEADILQDRRKIYEWVLEPLFSIRGNY